MSLADDLEDLGELITLGLRVDLVNVVDDNLNSNDLVIADKDCGRASLNGALNALLKDGQDLLGGSLETLPHRVVLRELIVDEFRNLVDVFLAHHIDRVVFSLLSSIAHVYLFGCFSYFSKIFIFIKSTSISFSREQLVFNTHLAEDSVRIIKRIPHHSLLA